MHGHDASGASTGSLGAAPQETQEDKGVGGTGEATRQMDCGQSIGVVYFWRTKPAHEVNDNNDNGDAWRADPSKWPASGIDETGRDQQAPPRGGSFICL